MENEGNSIRKTFNAIDEIKRKVDDLDILYCDIENSGTIPMGHKYRAFVRRVDMLVCSTLSAIQECVDAANEAGIGRIESTEDESEHMPLEHVGGEDYEETAE